MHASYEPQRAALAVGLRVVEVPAVSVDAPLAVDFLPHDQRPTNTETRLSAPCKYRNTATMHPSNTATRLQSTHQAPSHIY